MPIRTMLSLVECLLTGALVISRTGRASVVRESLFEFLLRAILKFALC
jgi:hypothetical protein